MCVARACISMRCGPTLAVQDHHETPPSVRISKRRTNRAPITNSASRGHCFLTTYAQLELYLAKFSVGKLRLVLLLGRHGTGKSESVKRALSVPDPASPTADNAASTPLYVDGTPPVPCALVGGQYGD